MIVLGQVVLSLEDLDSLTEGGTLVDAKGEVGPVQVPPPPPSLSLAQFEQIVRNQLQLYVQRTLASSLEQARPPPSV